MGVFKSRVKYRSDGGQQFHVADMATSHLINAIGHHNKQLDTIEDIMQSYTGDLLFIKQRREDLEETVDVLTDELIERDPAKDPERRYRRA